MRGCLRGGNNNLCDCSLYRTSYSGSQRVKIDPEPFQSENVADAEVNPPDWPGRQSNIYKWDSSSVGTVAFRVDCRCCPLVNMVIFLMAQWTHLARCTQHGKAAEHPWGEHACWWTIHQKGSQSAHLSRLNNLVWYPMYYLTPLFTLPPTCITFVKVLQATANHDKMMAPRLPAFTREIHTLLISTPFSLRQFRGKRTFLG